MANSIVNGNYKFEIISDQKLKLIGFRNEDSRKKNILIPEQVNGYVVTAIGESAFRDKYEIENVLISKNIEVIEKNAFENCYGVTSLRFENNSRLSKISELAFFNTTNLKHILLPSSVKFVEKNAFGSNSLTIFPLLI